MPDIDPRKYTDGSSSLVLGCDSYTSPAELDDREYLFGQNVVCRGGIVQTRPGTRSLYCPPQGNFQGFCVFTPANGVAHHVFAVDGKVYVAAAPFTSYRRLWNIQFSVTAKYIAWASCLKSTDYDISGNLISLANPYSVLVMQDGLTRAAYWDGGNSGHLNPGTPAFPDQTDVVPGFTETPIGLWMIWSGNRLWVSRENQVFASDLGNPLKFTEAQYLNEVRAFFLSGPCTGMIELPSDTAGAKGFIAFTETDGTLFQSYIQDRTQWQSTPLFQNTILPNVGCVAPRSLTTQYGLNWWFAARGFTNLNAAFRQNLSSRIDYQDNEMFSSKAYLGPDLSGICASFYENYLMCSVPSADVLNRHTWVLDQAPMEGNANAWTGIWTGWRPIEWGRGIVNGSERVFFGSVDYDGRNRVWEAMLPERTDNGCRITCYAQLRDHAAGNLDQKKYDWSKFFISQMYGEVDLNIYVASTKGSYQLQKNYHMVASEGQVFSDTEYSEVGPYLMGNRVQSRIIRTPSGLEDNDCNKCGVESKHGNLIDYAFSHLLVWSGQMGIRAYQMHMKGSPDRDAGDCEEPEVAPRTLNAQGCSGLELLVDGEVFEEFEATAEGTTVTREGGSVYIRQTATSVISQENAQSMAECRVKQIINQLHLSDIAVGVYDSGSAEMGTNTSFVVVSGGAQPNITMQCESQSGSATLCGYSEYTTPSVPPKKYRRRTLSGGSQAILYSDAGCATPSCTSDYAFSGFCEYSADDCAIAPGGTLDVTASGGACGGNASYPQCDIGVTYVAGGDSEVLTPTTRGFTNDLVCHPGVGLASFKRPSQTTALETLSVEATEDEAIARAVKTPGASCTAFKESRGAGDFTFLFRTVAITVNCFNLNIGTEYTVRVDVLEENYGGGSPVTTTRQYTFTATSESHTINDTLVPASGKQLTASNERIA